jgi:Flp pilus assembly protein TadG
VRTSGTAGAFARSRRGERGAVAVEFALIVPIFLVLVLGIIEFGNAINRDTMINNASREAAREGSLNPVVSDVQATALASLPTGSLISYAVNVTCQAATGGVFGSCAAPESGGVVRVAITANYRWVTPLPSMVPGLGTGLVLNKQSEMRIE